MEEEKEKNGFDNGYDIENPGTEGPGAGCHFWAQQAGKEPGGYRMKKEDIPRDEAFNSRYIETSQEEEKRHEGSAGPDTGAQADPYRYYSDAPKRKKKERVKKQRRKKEKKPMGLGKRFALLLAGAAVFGIVAGFAFQGVLFLTNREEGGKEITGQAGLNNGGAPNISSPIGTTETISVPDGAVNDVRMVVKNAEPSIVAITSTVSETNQFWGISRDYEGSGSGIIIDKNETNLLIVTNNHVVSGAKNIAVTFIDGETAAAQVKGSDSGADLAVITVKLKDLKKSTSNEIRTAAIGDSGAAEVGDKVVAIGNALGYGQSVTVGYISAKDRTLELEEGTMELLQTDAAINPGNSGGALLNMKGEVIGINSVKYSEVKVEGIGFAIPITKALPIMEELKTREKVAENEKGYLGITLERVTEEENTSYNMPLGIFVKDLSKDGAAREAGILKGDIITAVNGMEVRTEKALQERVNAYKAGTEITVSVMRYENGEYVEMNFKVTLKGEDTLKELEENQQGGEAQDQKIPYDGGEGYSEEDLYDFFNQFMR